MLKKVLSLVVVFIMMSSVVILAANDADGDPYEVPDYTRDAQLTMNIDASSDKQVYSLTDTFATINVTASHTGTGGDGNGTGQNADVLLVLYDGDNYLVGNPNVGANPSGHPNNLPHVSVNGSFSLSYNYDMTAVLPGETVTLTAKVYDYGMGMGNGVSGWSSKLIATKSVSFTKESLPVYDINVDSNAASMGISATFSAHGGLTDLPDTSVRTVDVSPYDTDTFNLAWTNNPATINGADETVTATFSYKQYQLNVTQDEDVSASITVAYADQGKNGTGYTATLDETSIPEGYIFDGWSNGVSSPVTSGTFDGADVDLTAYFVPVFDIEAIVNPASGTGAMFDGVGPGFRNGTHRVSLIGYDEASFVFTGWSNGGDGLSTDVIVDDEDASVTANFVNKLYTVSASANIAGTNAVFSGTGSEFLNGSGYEVELVAFDDSAYIFEGWSVEPIGKIDGEDVHIVANFSVIPPLPNTYAVRVNSNLPGANAIFSGYGTGFSDGQAYNVDLTSFDSTNYEFIGYTTSQSGTIAGSDVLIVANFQEIIVDEPTPEEPPVEEPPVEEPEVDEPEEPIVDEPTPEESPVEEPEEELLDDVIPEDVPEALPETSGVPFDVFGFGGFASILAGLFIRKRK